MTQKFIEAGYDITSFEEEADIYIINTCTVTNIADRKSRQMLRRAKQLNPNAIIAAVRLLRTNTQRTAGRNRRNRFGFGK